MSSIRTELKAHGLFLKKRLGQHFLADRNVLERVVQTAQVENEDVVLEIGSGLGGMTIALARQAKKVIAVEIDPKIAAILKEKLKDYSNAEVIEGDVLKLDLGLLLKKEVRPVKVVANLPYQISTPLLFRFIESKEIFSSLTLMLQKEVAERLVAQPGRKAYGPLSVFIQLLFNPSICFYIKASAFFPVPKVESAVVHMIWKERPAVDLKDEEWFKKVVRGCFGYRRKTLLNSLKHSGLSLPGSIDLKLNEIGIDPRRRPETLTIQEFAYLSEAIK